MQKKLYRADENHAQAPSNEHFFLHNHSEYEIFLFLEGDSQYVVEEMRYDLAPGDVMIVRKHEMHRVYHKSSAPYHRIVIVVSPEFFRKEGYAEFEEVFLDRTKHLGNRISAHVVHTKGLYDAIMRLKKYSDGFERMNTVLTDSVMVEILYLINQVSLFENADKINNFFLGLVKSTIRYINTHFTEEITLDSICGNFFVSKYHLCRMFKRATGLTIQQYIKQKRLTMARERVEEGYSLTEAALGAGFRDYSSFWRAYTKHYGQNPREGK